MRSKQEIELFIANPRLLIMNNVPANKCTEISLIMFLATLLITRNQSNSDKDSLYWIGHLYFRNCG